MKSTDRAYLAYIFDFDYTLGDATDGIVMCVNFALNKLKFPQCDREDIRKTIGLTLNETFERLTKIEDKALGNEFAKQFKEKADQDMIKNTELFPDTIQTLISLRNRGGRIGIVTTKFHYRIDEILSKFQIHHLVDVIVGGEDVKRAKPDPEGLLSAIRELDVPTERVLYIGDSIVDAKTAYHTNVDFVAVTTGTTQKEDFTGFPHKHIIGSISELLRCV